MGNTCTACTSTNAAHVLSIRQVGSVDQLTFTDIDDAWQIAMRDTIKGKSVRTATVIKRTGWITVRVFVSSTFRDFDAEREILVKKVFPDLREWCQSRRLNLVEIDLRWGVPKDSTTETTLRTCLGEIDRCYAENVMPFFVNMTSERIGWIPLGSRIPESLKQEYKWVEGLSVTEMEILHGAYRIDNPNALFMIRETSFLKTVPEEQRHHFVDECALAPYKLQQLKKHISEKFKTNSRVCFYECEYMGMDKDTKMPRFKGLEENFASVVLNFFKERIAAQYPLIDEKKLDPIEEAKTQHESFMKMASERVVGRDALIDEFVASYINATENVSPVVVFGGPGLGKTSIMAALADRCASLATMRKLPTPTTAKRWRVFFHFVGAVVGSTDQLIMLNRLLIEMKTLRKEHKLPTSLDEAMGLVRGALSNPKTKNCIVIVDAINQFDDNSGMPAPISWLPSKMSPTVRIFFSLTPESAQFKNVRESGTNWAFLQLQPLDRETKERMVTSNLARYNKQLDRGQLELLLNKRSSDNPMWLSLATEELRVFGRFRELTNKIRALPDGLPELEADILGRFEREGDGRRLVATLCLLETSVRGLLENELVELLAQEPLLPPTLMEKISAVKTSYDTEGDDDNGTTAVANLKLERLTASQWADIYRVLRPFMRPFGASGEGRLDFYHRSLSKAVRNRYYFKMIKGDNGKVKQERQEDVVKWFHQRLADYFGAKCKHLERRVEEFPTHAYKCSNANGLRDFLCKWDVFDLMYDPEFARQLSQSWEHACCIVLSQAPEGTNEKPKSGSGIFELMEKDYVALMDKDLENYEKMPLAERKDVIRHIEYVARVLAQNGRFDAAFSLSEKLIKLAFPDLEKPNVGVESKVPFVQRQFDKAGEKLPPDERLQYGRYLHLQASIYDEEMRQVDYMYVSQIPKILVIIESLESAVAIFRQLAPKDMLIGRSLNRCSFFYSGIEMRGGCEVLPRAECTPLAIKRIEEAIEFYSSMANQEINKADCYITRGVVAVNKSEQIEHYNKGLNLVLDNAGQLHPLLDRSYLNIAIYYEEIGDRMTAYNNFRKWYALLLEIFGANHPRTLRAVRCLNEAAYVAVAKQLGHTIPKEGAVVTAKDEDDFIREQTSIGNNPPPQQQQQQQQQPENDEQTANDETDFDD